MIWVELGIFGFLPNETKGLILALVASLFGLKVVVKKFLVGSDIFVIPISFVSGKIINGLVVVVVDGIS